MNVVGTTNLSRDNTGECCSGGDYTLSLAENTAGTGRKAGIQFHDGGVSEGQLRLDNGTNGRELKVYSYQTDLDLHATGFVQGDQGLCIGNDCRNAWPGGSGNHPFINVLVDGQGGSHPYLGCPAGYHAAGTIPCNGTMGYRGGGLNGDIMYCVLVLCVAN